MLPGNSSDPRSIHGVNADARPETGGGRETKRRRLKKRATETSMDTKTKTRVAADPRCSPVLITGETRRAALSRSGLPSIPRSRLEQLPSALQGILFEMLDERAHGACRRVCWWLFALAHTPVARLLSATLPKCNSAILGDMCQWSVWTMRPRALDMSRSPMSAAALRLVGGMSSLTSLTLSCETVKGAPAARFALLAPLGNTLRELRLLATPSRALALNTLFPKLRALHINRLANGQSQRLPASLESLSIAYLAAREDQMRLEDERCISRLPLCKLEVPSLGRTFVESLAAAHPRPLLEDLSVLQFYMDAPLLATQNLSLWHEIPVLRRLSQLPLKRIETRSISYLDRDGRRHAEPMRRAIRLFSQCLLSITTLEHYEGSGIRVDAGRGFGKSRLQDREYEDPLQDRGRQDPLQDRGRQDPVPLSPRDDFGDEGGLDLQMLLDALPRIRVLHLSLFAQREPSKRASGVDSMLRVLASSAKSSNLHTLRLRSYWYADNLMLSDVEDFSHRVVDFAGDTPASRDLGFLANFPSLHTLDLPDMHVSVRLPFLPTVRSMEGGASQDSSSIKEMARSMPGLVSLALPSIPASQLRDLDAFHSLVFLNLCYVQWISVGSSHALARQVEALEPILSKMKRLTRIRSLPVTSGFYRSGIVSVAEALRHIQQWRALYPEPSASLGDCSASAAS